RQRGHDSRGHLRIPAGSGRGGGPGGGGPADRRVDGQTAAERRSGRPTGRDRHYAKQVDRCSLIAPCIVLTGDRVAATRVDADGTSSRIPRLTGGHRLGQPSLLRTFTAMTRTSSCSSVREKLGVAGRAEAARVNS